MGATILFVSGETYGYIYSKSLVMSLEDILSTITVKCIGGRDMRRTGTGGLATEALNRELDSEKVDCIILADQPSFDLHFIRKAKNKGISVIHYAGAYNPSLKSRQLKTLIGLIEQGTCHIPLRNSPIHSGRY